MPGLCDRKNVYYNIMRLWPHTPAWNALDNLKREKFSLKIVVGAQTNKNTY